jgi:hypothetical protein
VLLASLVGVGPAAAQDSPAQVTAPQPTVPEIFTLQGQFVRTAYNSEGFANIGYRIAQEQVGKEWIMLQFGVTLRKPTPNFTLKREHLTTPDGSRHPEGVLVGWCRSQVPDQAGEVREGLDQLLPGGGGPGLRHRVLRRHRRPRAADRLGRDRAELAPGVRG